jgi:hypothetical protein
VVCHGRRSAHGLGPAASKVYRAQQGVALGGYGELLYRNFVNEDKDDVFDFQRAVLYVGYKFNDKFVLNTEIEVEHAKEIFVEFAYVDYLFLPELSFRAGMVLLRWASSTSSTSPPSSWGRCGRGGAAHHPQHLARERAGGLRRDRPVHLSRLPRQRPEGLGLHGPGAARRAAEGRGSALGRLRRRGEARLHRLAGLLVGASAYYGGSASR